MYLCYKLYKWKQRIFDLLRLVLLIQHKVLKSTKSLHIAVVCSFELLHNIPGYGRTSVCLTIQVLRTFLVVSIFWLLKIKLLWTFMHGISYGCKFSLHWENAQECVSKVYVELFKKLPSYFSKWLYHLHSNQQHTRSSFFSSLPAFSIVTF